MSGKEGGREVGGGGGVKGRMMWKGYMQPLIGITIHVGANIGMIFGFLLSGLLCEYGFDGGWPSVFYIFGKSPLMQSTSLTWRYRYIVGLIYRYEIMHRHCRCLGHSLVPILVVAGLQLSCTPSENIRGRETVHRKQHWRQRRQS